MAKDLSGTNIAAEKEALFNKPVFLIEIVRDHPETGESILYYGTWTKSYALGGNTYLDTIAQDGLGDLRQNIAAGGGIAYVDDWTFVLDNPDGADRLSHMLDDYFIENDEIRYKLVFRDGSETASDILTLYFGKVIDFGHTTEAFEIFSKDATRATLKDVPQEVTDLVEFPNIPLDNINKPLPAAFGDLNVEPFNTSGARPRLATCICVDVVDLKYTSGRFNKTYGQPYVFYRTARFWGKIVDYTQSGAFFTIDSSSRFTKIKPIRALGTNDVADWRNVVDGSTSTGADIENGDNLDVQFRGSPKLGTISDIKVEIVATGGFDYIIVKAGEANIAGSGVGDTSIDLDGAGWDFSTNWDFEQIQVFIDGTGSATINLITLDVTFLEQETGDQLAFPVFQSAVGYEDQAAQYADGGVINGAGTALEIPIDVLLALQRDKRLGMRMAVASIETSTIAAERAKISDWEWAFSLSDTLDIDVLDEIVGQGKLRLFQTYDGKWKFSVFDKTAAPAAHFSHGWNINVRNPEAPAGQQRSSLRVFQSPMPEIFNEFVLHYGWDEALGEYTEIEIASPHYLVTGTCTLDLAAGTLTDGSATFQTDGVQVGYKVFVARDQLYQVDAVNSETELDVSTVEAGGEISDGHSDTYYIGPNFDFQCFRSVQKYKLTNRKTIHSKVVQDGDTAEAMIEHEVEYWSERRTMVEFRTSLNAVDLELTDLILVDHPDLTPKKRPILLGTLSAGINDSATALPMTGTGALLAREDDVLIIQSVNTSGKYYREVVVVTGIDEVNGEIDVTRAQGGTPGRSWDAGDQVYRTISKFEVVENKLLGNEREIQITGRETPRDYTPIGHVAPDGTPDYTSASAEERARYGWCCYPNGEVVWLDPDSAESYAGN